MFKIGVVGTGLIAESHKDAVLKNPESEITCVCDIDRDKALKFAEGSSAIVYTDYKEMAEKEEIDAVIINLPHFLHKDATVYFLNKKINVLCEKPMAISSEECEEMNEAAKRNNVKLAIGHVQRYSPAHREIKKMIENKTFGDLCLITETRNIDYFSSDRPIWFLDKTKSGGGIVMNYGAHSLDKILYFTDSDVVSVSANIDNTINDKNIEAQAQALLKLENNVSVTLSYCASRINYLYETYLFFTDGIIRVEDGIYLWIAEKDVPFHKVELDYDVSLIECQWNEFIKLIKNEKADIADAMYGKKIISVIEEILN